MLPLACCPLHNLLACLHIRMHVCTYCLNTASLNASALIIEPSSNLVPVVTALQKADLWSCGVVLYALLYGRYPFDAEYKYYVRKIVAAEYVIPQDIPVSSECRHLLQGLLVADPEKRMSIKEMLSQPWLCQDLPQGALEMNHTYLAYPLSLHQVGGLCLNEVLCCASNRAVSRLLAHMHPSVDSSGAMSRPTSARLDNQPWRRILSSKLNLTGKHHSCFSHPAVHKAADVDVILHSDVWSCCLTFIQTTGLKPNPAPSSRSYRMLHHMTSEKMPTLSCSVCTI